MQGNPTLQAEEFAVDVMSEDGLCSQIGVFAEIHQQVPVQVPGNTEWGWPITYTSLNMWWHALSCRVGFNVSSFQKDVKNIAAKKLSNNI